MDKIEKDPKGTNDKDVNAKENLLTKISEPIKEIDNILKFTISFLAIITATITYGMKVSSYKYSIKAYELYGVPVFYFEEDNSIRIILGWLMFAFAILLIISPIIIKLMYKKSAFRRMDAIGVSGYLGLVFLAIFSTLLNRIGSLKISIIFLLLLLILPIFIYKFLRLDLRSPLEKQEDKDPNVDESDKKSEPNNEEMTDEDKKEERKKSAYIWALMIPLSILLISSFGFIQHPLDSPYDLKNYEVVLGEDNNHQKDDEINRMGVDVIVKRKDKMAVAISGEVIDGQILTFNKGTYNVINIENRKLKNITINNLIVKDYDNNKIESFTIGDETNKKLYENIDVDKEYNNLIEKYK
ncbi:hypothetical protein [Anaerococcus lactolyticus]|uniref:hypothetical protein n=1 Tax=Anaerococcus lactolyticus TaxID=33032 RepID=UPI00288A31CC|nr:hypothetical protein [Anaerococcus lactolyticus]